MNKGFLAELSRTALERAGYRVKTVIVPWKRALRQTQRGEYGAVMGASHTKERAKTLRYPDSAWEIKMSFFSSERKKQKTYENPRDLCPAKVVVIRGTYLHAPLKALGCLDVGMGDLVEENIMGLISGRFDCYLESEDAVRHYLANVFPSEKGSVRALSPPFEIDRIYTAFSRRLPKHDTIVDDFDKAIQSMKEDGVYNRILKKHGLESEIEANSE